MWPPKDAENCWTESIDHKSGIKVKFKETDSNIAAYKELNTTEKNLSNNFHSHK